MWHTFQIRRKNTRWMSERNTTVRLRGDTGNWQATLAGAVDSSFRSGCSMKQSLGLWRGGGGRGG